MYFPNLSEGVLFTMEFQEVIYWQCAIPCCYEWLIQPCYPSHWGIFTEIRYIMTIPSICC